MADMHRSESAFRRRGKGLAAHSALVLLSDRNNII
jgi:hypothetical protein